MSVEHHGALPKGYRLQEYRLDRVLGFGGFGITYLATDTTLKKLVAIKEYLPNDLALRSADASVVPKASECREDFQWGLDRFLDEARILGRLHHSHLVTVHRFFEANGTAYMVMEYAPGERLADILRRTREQPSEDEMLSLLSGLLSGIEAVHRAGYLHRDVKPSNIIVRADGTPILIDFGAARQSLEQRSHAVTSIITPGYAPLEQYIGNGNQGPWTDLYAVGAVAHRIITGAPPPEATARARVDPYRPLAGQNLPGYSKPFLRAIDWALRVDEHERPQTVQAFRRALFGELDPPAEGAAGQTARFTSPNDPGTPATNMPARRKGQSVLEQRPHDASASRSRKVLLVVGLVVLFTAGGGYFAYQQYVDRHNAEAADQQRRQAEEGARQEAERTRLAAEQARRTQAEREAAEKAATEERARQTAEQARRDNEAADKAARDAAAAPQPESSQRSAAEARDAAAKARALATEVQRRADVARERAGSAREKAAASVGAANGPGADKRTYAGGATYAGGMSGDARQGTGVLVTPSGYRYEGEWRADAAHGLGVSKDGKGERYEGEWANGNREGHGVYAWPNGQRYDGEYLAGKRQGLGALTSANGWRTEARWVDGEINGLAVTSNAGQHYEGMLRESKYDGPGVYTWADGQRYEGMYRNDKRNGYGILYLANGTKKSGLWQDGNLVKSD